MKPKKPIDIDAVGGEALQLFAQDRVAAGNLKDIRSQKTARKEQLKKALTIIWDAFKNGATVNGYTTRKEWCQNFAEVTTRTCENILYGRAERKANHGSVKVYELGDMIKIGKRTFHITSVPESGDELSKTKLGSFRLTYLCEEVFEKTAPKKKEKRYSTKVNPSFMLMPAKPHKTHKMQTDSHRTWCGKTPGDTLAADAKMSDDPTCKGCRLGEHMDKMRKEAKSIPPAPKVKTVDPDEELMKRFYATRKIAKFYTGMMDEFGAMNKFGAVSQYDKLLELYADNEGRGDHRYPWAAPSKGYELPKTQKEFEAEFDKASDEFNKVVAEGEASGALTTAPRAKKMHPAAQALAEVVSDAPENCPTEEEVL